MNESPLEVLVFSRPGCHLCEEAVTEIRRHLAGRSGNLSVSLKEVNIETSDELHRRYLERIPVVMVDGEIVCEIFFDPEAFEEAIQT